MRNKLVDLNNHLFEQLERLNDDSLKGDNLKEELHRSKAMAHIATKIIDNGHLVVKASKTFDDTYDANRKLPKMLKGGENNE